MNLNYPDYSLNSRLLNETQLALFEELLLTRTHWDEHELLKLSFAQLHLELPNFNDALSLFQGHFIVFNALYRLIAKAQCPKYIVLEVTRIQLLAQDDSHSAQPVDQTLMAYYLDEENLINTSRFMIQSMLEQWGIEFTQYLNDEQAARLYQTHKGKAIPHK